MEIIDQENDNSCDFPKLYKTTSFDCPLCSLPLNKSEELQNHLSEHHNNWSVYEILSPNKSKESGVPNFIVIEDFAAREEDELEREERCTDVTKDPLPCVSEEGKVIDTTDIEAEVYHTQNKCTPSEKELSHFTQNAKHVDCDGYVSLDITKYADGKKSDLPFSSINSKNKDQLELCQDDGDEFNNYCPSTKNVSAALEVHKTSLPEVLCEGDEIEDENTIAAPSDNLLTGEQKESKEKQFANELYSNDSGQSKLQTVQNNAIGGNVQNYVAGEVSNTYIAEDFRVRISQNESQDEFANLALGDFESKSRVSDDLTMRCVGKESTVEVSDMNFVNFRCKSQTGINDVMVRIRQDESPIKSERNKDQKKSVNEKFVAKNETIESLTSSSLSHDTPTKCSVLFNSKITEEKGNIDNPEFSEYKFVNDDDVEILASHTYDSHFADDTDKECNEIKKNAKEHQDLDIIRCRELRLETDDNFLDTVSDSNRRGNLSQSVETVAERNYLDSFNFTVLKKRNKNNGMKERSSKIIIASLPVNQEWVGHISDVPSCSLSVDGERQSVKNSKNASPHKEALESISESVKNELNEDIKPPLWYLENVSAPSLPHTDEYFVGFESRDNSTSDRHDIDQLKVEDDYTLANWDRSPNCRAYSETSKGFSCENVPKIYSHDGNCINKEALYLGDVSLRDDCADNEADLHLRIENVFCLKDKEPSDKNSLIPVCDENSYPTTPSMELGDPKVFDLSGQKPTFARNAEILPVNFNCTDNSDEECLELTSEAKPDSAECDTVLNCEAFQEDNHVASDRNQRITKSIKALETGITGTRKTMKKCLKCKMNHACSSLVNNKCISLAFSLKPYKCSQCTFSCSSKDNLIFHIRRCFRKRRIRGKMAKQQTNSILKQNKSASLVNCPLCQENFESKFIFVQHLFRKHAEYIKSNAFKSQILDILDKSEKSLQTAGILSCSPTGTPSEELHNDESLPASTCNDVKSCLGLDSKEVGITSAKEKRLHKTFENKGFCCSLCETKFQSLYQLSFHRINEHAGEFDPRNISGLLKTADGVKAKRKIFEGKKGSIHDNKTSISSKNDSWQYNCSKCILVFKSQDLLFQHKRVQHNQKFAQCVFCKKYLKRRQFKLHVVNCIQMLCSRKLDKNYHDKILDKNFHDKIHDPLQTYTIREPSSTNTDKKFAYICPVCLQSFRKRVIYFDHLCTHIPFRPYQCHSCGNEFMRKRALQDHIQSCKSNVESLKPTFAATKSGSKGTGKVGIMVMENASSHNIPSTVTSNLEGCDNIETPKEFKFNLPEKGIYQRKTYDCSYCHKGFTLKKDLFYHNCEVDSSDTNSCNYKTKSDCQTYHSVELRPDASITLGKYMQCSMCSETFKCNNDLEKHMSYVHGNFKCLYCFERFKNKINLKYHTLECRTKLYSKKESCLKHDKASQDTVEFGVGCNEGDTSLENTVKIESYNCSVCDRHFRSYYHLYSHKVMMHNGRGITFKEKELAKPSSSSVSDFKGKELAKPTSNIVSNFILKKVRFQKSRKESQNICTSCGKTFLSVKILKSHTKICSELKKNGKQSSVTLRKNNLMRKNTNTEIRKGTFLRPSHVGSKSLFSFWSNKNFKVLQKKTKDKNKVITKENSDSECESDDPVLDFEGFAKPYICRYCKNEFSEKFCFQLHQSKHTHNNWHHYKKSKKKFELRVQLKRINMEVKVGKDLQKNCCMSNNIDEETLTSSSSSNMQSVQLSLNEEVPESHDEMRAYQILDDLVSASNSVSLYLSDDGEISDNDSIMHGLVNETVDDDKSGIDGDRLRKIHKIHSSVDGKLKYGTSKEMQINPPLSSISDEEALYSNANEFGSKCYVNKKLSLSSSKKDQRKLQVCSAFNEKTVLGSPDEIKQKTTQVSSTTDGKVLTLSESPRKVHVSTSVGKAVTSCAMSRKTCHIFGALDDEASNISNKMQKELQVLCTGKNEMSCNGSDMQTKNSPAFNTVDEVKFVSKEEKQKYKKQSAVTKVRYCNDSEIKAVKILSSVEKLESQTNNSEKNGNISQKLSGPSKLGTSSLRTCVCHKDKGIIQCQQHSLKQQIFKSKSPKGKWNPQKIKFGGFKIHKSSNKVFRKREVKCARCKRTFKSLNGLKRHIRCSHSILYECLECLQRFGFKKVLQNHFRRCHPDKKMVMNVSYSKFKE